MEVERIDGREPLAGDALGDNGAERLDNPGDVAGGFGVEVAATIGNLAEPDRREVRSRLCLGRDRLDKVADLSAGSAPERPVSVTRAATAANMSRRISR